MPMRNKVAIVLLLLNLIGAVADDKSRWQRYKEIFVAKDGRVIDFKNEDTTHSEAVGYTLSLAIQYRDLETFKKVAKWMRDNLKTNAAGLSGWLWGKDRDGKWHQLDMNNATDGDLWIAYAFLKAYEWTKNLRYKAFALKRIEAIRKHLAYKIAGRTFLLPGLKGFVSKDHIILNPSYCLLHIYEQFSQYDDAPFWKGLYNDAVWLLEKSRYGPFALHPNWIYLYRNGSVAPARDRCYGYDALRVPLNILLSDLPRSKKRALLEGYEKVVRMIVVSKVMLGVVDLKEGKISYYNYSKAFYVVYRRVADFFGVGGLDIKLGNKDEKDYYSLSMDLLAGQ